jgi:hypothetical protein
MAALTRLSAMAVAVSLFSCVAWAQTYPVLTYPISGVWVERADRFPGLTAGASLILKKLGEDAVLAQPLPNFLIFSKDRRFEVRGDRLAEKNSDLSRAQRTAAFKSQGRWANSGTLFLEDLLSH